MALENRKIDDRPGPVSPYLKDLQGMVGAGIVQSLELFIEKLLQEGATEEIIERALASVVHDLKEIGAHHQSSAKVENLSDTRKAMRKDFFGRAVLFHIQDLFPQTEEDATKLAQGQIDGSLPREIAPGLIEAIKIANDEKMLAEYEDFFIKKAERYRRRTTNKIDLTSFANDGGVRSVARNMIKKFEALFNEKGEKGGKAWLMKNIEASPSFQRIGRSFSEKEYQTLRDNIFRIR